MQVYKPTETSLLRFVISRHSPGPTEVNRLSALTSDTNVEKSSRAIRLSLHQRTDILRNHVDTRLRGEQARYKRNYSDNMQLKAEPDTNH